MNRSQPIRTRHQRIAAYAVMLCLVYQLGACPCGCLEHNAWLQLLGLQMHDHGVAATGDGLSTPADDHDCTGEPRPQYVNNARAASLVDGSAAPVSLLFAACADQRAIPSVAVAARSAPPPDDWGDAFSRTALQVFRL